MSSRNIVTPVSIHGPCGVIADFCGVIADLWGVIADPCGVAAIVGRAVTDAAMPIVARLTKLRKTLLNIVKHHETLLNHCEMS